MIVFKVLHVLSMFIAVTLLVGESTFMAIAIWRRDVRALAAIRRLVGRRPVVSSFIFLVGIGFGLLTVATGGSDFFAGWLIAAYVMVVALFAISGLPVVQKGLLGLVDKATERRPGSAQWRMSRRIWRPFAAPSPWSWRPTGSCSQRSSRTWS